MPTVTCGTKQLISLVSVTVPFLGPTDTQRCVLVGKVGLSKPNVETVNKIQLAATAPQSSTSQP